MPKNRDRHHPHDPSGQVTRPVDPAGDHRLREPHRHILTRTDAVLSLAVAALLAAGIAEGIATAHP